MTNDQALPEGVTEHWEAVMAEAGELGEEYREDGWEVTLVHPGDVTALFDDPFGVDVLAPGDEFEAVKSLAEGHSFDRSHVYRQSREESTFFVTVFESTADAVAVIVPAYVSREDLDRLFDVSQTVGEMQLHVRPLSNDERATFVADDPDPFFDT